MKCVSFTGLKLFQAETAPALDFLEPNLTGTGMGRLEAAFEPFPLFWKSPTSPLRLASLLLFLI